MSSFLNLYDIRQLIDETFTDILNPPEGIKLDGWNSFNDITGGLRPHEFSIFCGGTGIGKTQWLAAIVASLVEQEIQTFAAPVETGAVDIMRRMFSSYGGYDFNTGDKPNAKMIDSLKDVVRDRSMKLIKFAKIATYEDRVDINAMITNLKYMSEKLGVKVAVLDNLNFFMKPTRSADQILQTDEVIHNFVILAKKIPIHLILVMHPSKTEGGKVISEFDIKGSSTAVQEATNVLLMNRVDEKDQINGLTSFHREFVFRKLRRRGFYVGRKFYMEYRNGKYFDFVPGGNGPVLQNKRVGTTRPAGVRPDAFLPNSR